MKTKKYICEVCHEEKAASEMSLSYKYRCKECVARQTREKRATTKLSLNLTSVNSENHATLGDWLVRIEEDGSLKITHTANVFNSLAVVPVADNAVRIYLMKR